MMMISHWVPGERSLLFSMLLFVMKFAVHLKQSDSFRNVAAPSSHHCSGMENRLRKATHL
jgi:hypothetical protein